ncbi:MAG: hypothetical protein HY744_10465 [Deltaproteobacteria bacterium]|nr:hypothetical protein [Deltaproteobacteria bacterium]
MNVRPAYVRIIVVVALLLAAGSARAQVKTYTVNGDFDTGTLDNVVDSPPNRVVLGPTWVSKTRLVWTTNYNYGFVLRMDSTTGKQTSRFDSALQFINGVPTGARPSQEFCNWSNTGNCPGRVAVDTNGDVWICNRAFGSQGTLSKFSGDIKHCIDRNNNGIIDTSKDANNDGVIAVNDPKEYFGQNDECILATIPVGPSNRWPRGVAVDKKGKIWACTFNEGKVYRFNPNEPVALEGSATVGGNPYSMATGGNYLFVSRCAGGQPPVRVNIDTFAVEGISCPGMGSGTYGVVGDPGGNVAWFGGHCSGDGIWRADFANKTCTKTGTGGSVTAVTLDLQGNVWGANYSNNTIHKMTAAGALLGTYPAGGSNPHGLSVDFDGNIWIVTHSPSMVKMNTSGQILGTYSIGGPGVPNADPYLYSDFTGVQVNRQAPYTYVGTWDAVYDGGGPAIAWAKVAWNKEPEGAVPAETSLVVSVRAADTPVGVGQAAYAQAGNGTPLKDVVGRYVQLRAGLKGPGYLTPTLSDITVTGPCDPLSENCCVKNADCNDGNPCTLDTCPAPGGKCQHGPAPGCCMTAKDCDDGDACTTDSCPVPGGACQHGAVPSCCNSNVDCADGDLCTVDLCSGPGGTCSHPVINGCCMTDLDCTKGNLCSNAKCPKPGGFCVGGMIPGCCTEHADCADNDACTEDVCDLQKNTCANAKVAGCCNLDGECDDANPCTTDTCTGAGGVCAHALLPGCCNPDDPKVGQPCDPPVSPYDAPPCKPGALACVDGKLECQGAVKPEAEKCNNIDDNCDGTVDSPPPCPVGTLCLNGVCVQACKGELGVCPEGFKCSGSLCLPTNCEQVICPEGEQCVAGECKGKDGGAGGGTGAAGPGGGGPAGGSGPGPGGGGPGPGDAGPGPGGTGPGQGGGAPDAGAPAPHWGLSTGGGGCQCGAAGAGRAPGGGLAVFGLLGALAFARRRRGPRAHERRRP